MIKATECQQVCAIACDKKTVEAGRCNCIEGAQDMIKRFLSERREKAMKLIARSKGKGLVGVIKKL